MFVVSLSLQDAEGVALAWLHQCWKVCIGFDSVLVLTFCMISGVVLTVTRLWYIDQHDAHVI